jgi:hypothetical protein
MIGKSKSSQERGRHNLIGVSIESLPDRYMQNRKNTDMLSKPIKSMKAGELCALIKTKQEKLIE